MSIAPKPATLCLPRLQVPPETVFDYLCRKFSGVSEAKWRTRIAEGKVFDATGQAISTATSYRAGLTIHYFREVSSEGKIPFLEEIIFQNDHFLIADKPHFLPVTPAGNAVNECLLYRLQKRTGLADLTAVHRLDRETAGLVLFSVLPYERSLYTGLFADRRIVRRYVASSWVGGSHMREREWILKNRLVPGDPWFTMKIVDGEVNAITRIAMSDINGGVGLFELNPETGKKHQLRVHMMSLGFPILNDPYYPNVLMKEAADYSSPLQLLAKTLEFTDPVSGKKFVFESKQKLG